MEPIDKIIEDLRHKQEFGLFQDEGETEELRVYHMLLDLVIYFCTPVVQVVNPLERRDDEQASSESDQEESPSRRSDESGGGTGATPDGGGAVSGGPRKVAPSDAGEPMVNSESSVGPVSPNPQAEGGSD